MEAIMNGELLPVAAFLCGNPTPADVTPWQALRAEDIRVIREWLSETQSIQEQRRLMKALRLALRDAEPSHESDADPVRLNRFRPRQLRRVALSTKLLETLVEAAPNETRADCRSRAVIALMTLGGLRRKDVANVTLGAYESESGRLTIHGESCTRVIALRAESRSAMDAWLEQRGPAPGPLFIALNRPGNQSLGPSAINAIVSRRVGIFRLNPSDLRASFLQRIRSSTETKRFLCRYSQTEEGRAAWTYAALLPTD
jgi:integrase